MNLQEILSQQINMPQIKNLTAWASCSRENLSRLWEAVHSEDRLTGANALWVMTHLTKSDNEWLTELLDEMIDMLLCETDTGKKRMLLQLLREQEHKKDGVRTDLLDFCMSKINSECEPYAIRAFSIHLAFKLCRHYPELIAELEEHLNLMSFQPLSPGLQSALRQTNFKIQKLKSNRILHQ